MPPDDFDVPSTPTFTTIERHRIARQKQRKLFLKGPIEFGWIQDNIPDPTSRVLLVARAFMDMNGENKCALKAQIWGHAVIADPDQRRRVLAKLRKCKDYEVIDRRGRPSVLRKAIRRDLKTRGTIAGRR